MPDAATGCVTVWMSHGDTVLAPPPGFRQLATTRNTPVAAMAAPERRLYAVQFHPEVAHTPQGSASSRTSSSSSPGSSRAGRWATSSTRRSRPIRAAVGRERVLCALSGGVDSAVTAALVHRAIGDQLQCIFVDNGLLRQGEGEAVRRTSRTASGCGSSTWTPPSASWTASRGVTDPEQKRKIIGAEFIAVFQEEAERLGRSRSWPRARSTRT